MAIETYRYNDGMAAGSRTPRLYLVKGTGEPVLFNGENIPGVCAIAAQKYTKNGKWSNTDYSLLLAAGVRPLYFVSPLHGVWGDDLASWGEVAEKLALPMGQAQAIVRREYPPTAERLDAVEAFAVAQEEQGLEAETVVISFGGPTRRQRDEGFWSLPKSGRTSDGRTVTIEPVDGDWYHPVATAPEGATVMSSEYTPGMGGGYHSVTVMVPVL